MPARLVDGHGPSPVVELDPGAGQRLDSALRQFRQRAGLTQRQAAELAGISIGGLRDLEQGRVPTPRAGTLRRLAAALELSPADTENLVRMGRRSRSPVLDLCVQVLGPLTVHVDKAPVDLGSTRQRLLLSLLALSPNVPVGHDVLVEAVWGSDPPANVAGLLQANISRLRRRLVSPNAQAGSPAVLVAATGVYRLNVIDEQLDLLAFRRLVAQARRAKQDGDLARACSLYAASIALWRGEPVADQASLRTHPSIVALTRERQTTVVDYAAVAAELGRHDEVLPALRHATEAHPLDEAAHARLMIALAGSGQQAEALNVFTGLRQRLAEELGADPGHEMREAHQRVLRQEVGRPVVAGAAAVGGHRQLPPDIADFTGRDAELRAAHDYIAGVAENGPALGIVTIEGMAGVGKTRLAVHVAHQLLASGGYGDVQLYVDLRGHASEPPAEPSAVLASFLHLLGVPGNHIPHDLDGRAALYRDRLHARRALVLLDNAASVEQVMPLLPTGPASLVLITSRRALALDGGYTLPLDVFSHSDASALLAKIVGRPRVEADPQAAREVAELCGRLPLAIALVARRLQARPVWGFGDVVNRLRESSARLAELAAGTRRLRAAFDLSYQALEPDAQRVFCLLGLHPGHEFTPASVAAMCELDPAGARRLLDRLADEHLVTVVGGDRYRLHGLLRDYAREIVTAKGEQFCREAIARLLRWYAHALDGTRRLLLPHWRNDLGIDGERPPHLPHFPHDDDAFQWLDTEHVTLVAATELAAEWGFSRIAWQLSVALRPYFERTSSWEPWIATGRLGLDAARQVGDRRGEALVALGTLGVAYGQIGKLAESIELNERALGIHRDLGDWNGCAWALNNLGIAHGMRGDLAIAIEQFLGALEYTDSADDPFLTARLLSNLGHAHTSLGRHEQAIGYLEQALEIRKSSDDPAGIASTLHSLGRARLRVGQPDEAIRVLQISRDLHHRHRYRAYEAETLETLGEAFLRTGRRDRAQECWEQALTILERLPHSDTGEVAGLRERLRQDTAASPPTGRSGPDGPDRPAASP